MWCVCVGMGQGVRVPERVSVCVGRKAGRGGVGLRRVVPPGGGGKGVGVRAVRGGAREQEEEEEGEGEGEDVGGGGGKVSDEELEAWLVDASRMARDAEGSEVRRWVAAQLTRSEQKWLKNAEVADLAAKQSLTLAEKRRWQELKAMEAEEVRRITEVQARDRDEWNRLRMAEKEAILGAYLARKMITQAEFDGARPGFTQLAEVVNGRVATVALVLIVALEVLTGRGALDILGIPSLQELVDAHPALKAVYKLPPSPRDGR